MPHPSRTVARVRASASVANLKNKRIKNIGGINIFKPIYVKAKGNFIKTESTSSKTLRHSWGEEYFAYKNLCSTSSL
jgi:hypothetical protein